jgi:hypothetical protein
MFLRDLYCTECETVVIDVLMDDKNHTEMDMHCPDCGKQSHFATVCNGSSNYRVRFNDWPDWNADPSFYRGQYKAGSLTCKDSKDKTVRRWCSETKTVGDPMDIKPRYKNGTDEREGRRDVKVYATNRKLGKTPLVFDQKGK